MNDLPLADPTRNVIVTGMPLQIDAARALLHSNDATEREYKTAATAPIAALPVSFSAFQPSVTDGDAKYLDAGQQALSVGPLPDAFGVQ